jgi:hypothetical protein
VTFDLGAHGSSSDALVQTINYGEAASAPSVTPAEGQTFSGWDLAFNNITSDLTVTALYNTITYSVIFNLGDHGSSSDTLTQTVAHGAAASAPTVTANTGYSFTGWDETFNNITGNLTVAAQYSLNVYDVTFNSGEGTQSEVVQVNHGSAAAPATPADIIGKTFSHWDIGFSNITTDLTVTAIYTTDQYTVTFELGAHGTSSDALVQTINHGETASAPSVSATEGQTFSGWDLAFNNITSDLTITALYNTVTYIVTFDLNGGTHTGGGELIQSVEHGSSATAPVVESPEGYSFSGWSRTFDNVNSSYTVSAQFEAISDFKFTVTFDLGEQGSASPKSLVQRLIHGQTPKEPKIKVALGYEFLGWDKDIVPVTKSVTYSARYTDLTEEVRNLDQYDFDFTGAEIYDFTDTLKQINSVIEVNGKGQINSIYEEISGDNFRVGTYKGKIKNSKAGLNIKLSYKEKNFIDGLKGKDAHTMIMDLEDEQLIGTIKQGKEISPILYPLVNTDGQYQLDFSSLTMDSKGRYFGQVLLNLSSGISYQLNAKGKINLKNGIISLKLKGIKDQVSSGISLSVVINTDNIITQIRGKALGQKLLYYKDEL